MELVEIFWCKSAFDCFYVPACDYLGERMASLFGITSAKYQYAIDEYYRIKKEVRLTTFDDFCPHSPANLISSLVLVLERGREGGKPSVRRSRTFFWPAPISGTEVRAHRSKRRTGGGSSSPWRHLSGGERESGKPEHVYRPRYCDGNLTLSGKVHWNVCLSVCLWTKEHCLIWPNPLVRVQQLSTGSAAGFWLNGEDAGG